MAFSLTPWRLVTVLIVILVGVVVHQFNKLSLLFISFAVNHLVLEPILLANFPSRTSLFLEGLYRLCKC